MNSIMAINYSERIGSIYESYVGKDVADGVDRYDIHARIGTVSIVLLKNVPDFALEEEMSRCRDIIEAFYKILKEVERYDKT